MPSTLTLSPDEVEDAPKTLTLDPDEVEDAPAAAAPSIDYHHPAGAPGGYAPGVPQPRIDMQKEPGFFDRLAQNASPPEVAPGVSTEQDPNLVAQTLATVSGIPKVIQGAKDIEAGNPEFGTMGGQYGVNIPELHNTPKNPALVERGATEALQGASQAAMLAGGPAAAIEAPIESAVGLGAGYAGQQGAQATTKALGGSPEAQELAGTVGGLAAGTAGAMATEPTLAAIADATRQPEIIPPSRVTDVRQVQPARPLLTAGETPSVAPPQLEAGTPAPKQLTSGGTPADTPQAPPPAYGPERTHRVNPIPLYPQPEALPSRPTFTVGPDGQAIPTVAGELPPSVDQYSIDSARQHPVARVIGRDVNGQPIYQRVPGPDVSPVPVVAGVPQRLLPRGAIELPAPEPAATPDITVHPAGRVTAIDEETQLPIVRRPLYLDRSEVETAPDTLSAQGENLPPQIATAEPMSPEAEAVSARAAQGDESAGRQQAIAPRQAPEQPTPPVAVAENADLSATGAAENPETSSLGERIGTRIAMENQARGVLDDMTHQGISPDDVNQQFWDRTYFKLPAAAQQRFQRMLQGITGFEPGDALGADKNGQPIVAQDWRDVATLGNHFGDDPSNLQGEERGLVALMREANLRFGGTGAEPEAAPSSQVLSRSGVSETNEGQAQATERGDQQGDIDKAAGEMERSSPLVEGSDSNPQNAFRGGLEERHGGFGAIDPTRLMPENVRDYLAHEADLIGKSRKIHTGIYNLGEQYDADVLRANKLMQSLPGTPSDQAAVYRHLENPSEPLTKVQREILDKLAPFNRQAERIYQKLNPGKKLVPGYVHRIAQQKGSLLERILQGSKSDGRGNLLKKSAAASKKRSMLAIESKDGTRVPVSVSRGRVTAWHDNVPTDIGALRAGLTNPDAILDERLAPLEREEAKLKQEQRTLNETPSRQAAAGRRLQNIAKRLQEIEAERTAIEHEHTAENLPDKLWRDKNGDQWTFKQATTKEIEHHTPVEYYKNAAASTVTNWLELRKAERAHDFIEEVKSDPEFAQLGIKPANPSQIPDGWRSTQLPQFAGYYFEPHIAEVFDHYAKQLAAGKPGVLQQVGDFLTTSIFLNPLSHIPNLTTNWLTEKGVSVANPFTWGPEFKAGVKAFNAVVHQNQDFLAVLDAGGPMQSQKRAVRQFSDLLIKKLQEEAKEPEVSEKIADALGSIVNVPAALKAVVNFMADKSTWPVHDMFFLQSAYRKMAQQNIGLKAALEDTAKYIPDERLPTRVFNSKGVADVMQNPLLTMFSRYHYGILKGYGQILKNITGTRFEEAGTNAKGEPVNEAGRTLDQEKAHALNIAAGLALMLAVVYPTLDEVAQELTGNKDARVRRAGYTNFADALSRAIKGDITPLQAARSAVTPAVGTETAIDLAANRDVFGTGRKIYDPHADGKTIARQVGRRLAESVSPAQLAMRASESPLSTKRVLYSLIGVSFPRHGALALAAQLNADRIGDEPETEEQREKSILRSQARYSAWQGDMSGIEEARKSGLFSDQDMRKLEHEAKEQPLLYETRSMPVEDVLKVFRRATPEEKKILLPVLVRKGAQISKEPPAERADMRTRWKQALAQARSGASR